ncbi:MAG: gamma-glutamyl-gamma-aminobutyrate hydrolase family protein, partial [Alistipes sp.]|nr:gamma-glutamyl-gamma-aminobutyrate hydrolase family protein [Alistipes sp.]
QLAKMFGTTKLKTNSSHHQAVKDVAPGFRVVARAVDGTSEGYESTEGLLVWGVQFHPEGMLANGDKDALNFFKAFVRRVAKRK